MYKYLINRLVTLVLVLMAYAANAEGISPLGFIIGETTYKEALNIKPELRDAGINKFSQGKMLTANGVNWQLTGLKDVTLIFDSKQKLSATLLTLNKNQFDSIFNHLKSKYQVVNQQIPFVGNKYAKFKQNDVVIEVNAPHLSFEMTVLYATTTFKKAFEQIKRSEKETMKKQEGSLL